MGNLGIKAACVKTATMIMAKINSLKGEANGFASLDADGRIPSSQLPSYLDDVTDVALAQKIMQARDISLEKGQAKYRTYFVKTSLYQRYKEDVDTILGTTEQTNGDTYEDCIVAQ